MRSLKIAKTATPATPKISAPLPVGFLSLRSRFEQFYDQLIRQFTQGYTLRVWSECDRDGQQWWNADDPVTGQSIRHVSEADIRAWVEQRYNATPKSANRQSF